MTAPRDFHFTDSDTESNTKRRDPSEYLDFKRIVELKTPKGTRPAKLIIVRPLEKIKDYRETDPDMAWKTLVVADIAVLEAVPGAFDEFGEPLPAIVPGAMFRNQTIYQGMLCKAWRDQIGNTLIGVLYYGPNEKGQPPFLWRSLAKVPAATNLGQRFMMRFPQFLIPVPREPEAAAAAEQWSSPSTGASASEWGTQPGTQAADPWAQPQGSPVTMEQGWGQPAGQAPQHQQQPAQTAPAPVSPAPQGLGYASTDPWAQGPAQSVAPAQHHPQQGMSTLDQLKAAAQQGLQGQPQSQDPPF